jgi:anti-anti-sigma factor
MTDAEPLAGAQVQPVIVTLPAEIDMTNSGRIGRQLGFAQASGAAVVVADMTATTFCDSRGMRALVMAHKRATASGTELRLVVPSAAILQVMAITKLDTVLRIYPSLAAALPDGHS